MSFAKKNGLRLSVLLFGLSAFGLAITFSLNRVLGSPDSLKSALREGRVYEAISGDIADAIASSAYDSFAKQNMSAAGVTTGVKEAHFTDAAKQAVTPEIVRENGEKIIDGTYAWLEGSVPTPSFQLDTSPIQKQLATSLGQLATDRVSSLPACTLAQLQQLDLNAHDPFTIPCQPPGMNAATLRKQFEREVQANNSTLQGEAITAQDLNSSQGQSIFAELDRVPAVFQLGQKLPWIFGFLAILTTGLAIHLHEPRLRGVRNLSIQLLLAGLLLLATLAAMSFIVSYIRDNANIAIAANGAGRATSAIIQLLFNQAKNPLRVFVGLYVSIGIIGIVLPRFLRPHIRI